MLRPPNFPVSTPLPRDLPLIPDSIPGSRGECRETLRGSRNANAVRQELNSPVTNCLRMSLFVQPFPPKKDPDFISC